MYLISNIAGCVRVSAGARGQSIKNNYALIFTRAPSWGGGREEPAPQRGGRERGEMEDNGKGIKGIRYKDRRDVR